MHKLPKDLCEIHSPGASTREWLVSARRVRIFEHIHLQFAGFSDAGPGYRFVRHSPGFAQILACTSGEGRAFVDGRWMKFAAGQVYLTAAQAPCAYEIKPGGRWKLCWLIYDVKAHLPGFIAGQAPRLIEADVLGLTRAIEGICEEAGGASDATVLELWATLVHRQTLRLLQPGSTDSRLARLWQTVRQDLAGAWDLPRMAGSAGMSPESLRKLCHEFHARSPMAHLTRLRMRFASDLLACTREKISSIGERVGYSDPFAFSNAFKRELGLPPSRYRERQK